MLLVDLAQCHTRRLLSQRTSGNHGIVLPNRFQHSQDDTESVVIPMMFLAALDAPRGWRWCWKPRRSEPRARGGAAVE